MKLFVLCAAAALFGSRAGAQAVTITGDLRSPGGDRLNGTCEFSVSQAFRASDGTMIPDNLTMTVPFTAGALRVALQPTTTGFPSTSAYSVACVAFSQVVTGSDGKRHTSSGSWGPWPLVVEPTSSTLRDVLRYQAPPTTLVTYLATVSGASTTILAATHGLGALPWVTACANSSGNVFQPTVQVASNGDVTITGTSGMAGTCRLAGRADWVYVAAMSGRSVTVYATTHHLVRPMAGGCFDAAGAEYEPGGYMVNPASDDVTITAASSAPAFTGYCILQ